MGVRGLAATTVMMLVAALLSTTAATSPASAAGPGVPGAAASRGIPSAPAFVFEEGFQNQPPTPIIRLADYAARHGIRYNGVPQGVSECSSWLASANQDVAAEPQLTDCGGGVVGQNNWNQIQQLAQAIGLFNGENVDLSSDNRVDSGYGPSTIGDDYPILQMLGTIPIAPERFISLGVDVASVSCRLGSTAPTLQLNLLDENQIAWPAGDPIDGCSDTTEVKSPAVGTIPAATVTVGKYVTDKAVLSTGSSLGVSIDNQSSSGYVIDNVKIIDSTPALDQFFTPQSMEAGGTSELYIRITNTSELGAKQGWSFTDKLPAGLTVSKTDGAATTCSAGVVTAPAGGNTIGLKGNLDAGDRSCTLRVHVTALAAGTYTNVPSKFAVTGLNLPDPVGLTVTSGPAYKCSTDGYLFQNSLTDRELYQVDLTNGVTSAIVSPKDSLEAAGYNTTDGYLYASDATTGHLVKIASDGTLTTFPDPAGFSRGVFTVGDVDSAGHYWLTENRVGGSWIEIDFAKGSPTYGQTLATGYGPPTIGTGSDWVYVDGGLYSIEPSGHLIRFDTTTRTSTNLGALAGVPMNDYGAGFADAAGYLYFSSNATGQIYRVDIAKKSAMSILSKLPAGFRDGARCASAPIPTMTVTRTVDSRLAPADQFTVGLDRGPTVLTSVTTTGRATTASTTDWPVSKGTKYTVTAASAAGSPSPRGSYTATIACQDSNGKTIPTGGPARAWTHTVPGGGHYTCNVTNAPAAAQPGIALVKSATPSDGAHFTVGQLIRYSFVLTNTGNVALKNVHPQEAHFTGSGVLSAPACPAAASSLLPGAKVTCTAGYTLTKDDVKAGFLTNNATATGTPPNGPPIVSTAWNVTIPADGKPAVVVKPGKVKPSAVLPLTPLAATGISAVPQLLFGGGILLLLGGFLLLVGLRRRRSS